MSRSIALALVFVSSGTAAGAMDLTIKSSLSETFEANDNYFLSQTAKPIYRPQSTINFDALGRMPTSIYDLSGDFSYINYLGPGAESMTEQSAKQGGVKFRFENSGKAPGDKSNFFASWRTQDVVSAQLADTGTATGTGETTTTTVGGGLFRSLGLRDTISWNVTSSSTEFSSPSSTPYVNLDNVATWKHRLSPLTDIISLADYNWTWRDDIAQSETKFLQVKTGIKTSLTKRLDLTANVGIGLINGSQKNSTATPSTSSVPYPVFSGSGSAQGLLWDVALAYRLLKTTRVGISAAHTISADVFGNLSQRDSVAANLSHDINALSSLQLSAGLTRYSAPGSQGAASSDYDSYTASASYRRLLMKDLQGSITYTYRQRDNTTSSVDSNGVVVVVSKDITLLPHLQ